MNMLSNSDPNQNLCLYTFNQHSGRGQIGRNWYSGTDKNLSCSYKYEDLKIKAKDQFCINMAFSLAGLDFIKTLFSEEVSIKWPNDLYISSKKVAGILIQNSLKSDNIKQSVLGIGVNINEDNFPKELPNPISIFKVTGKKNSLVKSQLTLSQCVEKRMQELLGDKRNLEFEYQNQLYQRNVFAEYIIDNEIITAKIIGVSTLGKLQLEINNNIREFNFREVRFKLN